MDPRIITTRCAYHYADKRVTAAVYASDLSVITVEYADYARYPRRVYGLSVIFRLCELSPPDMLIICYFSGYVSYPRRYANYQLSFR